MCDSITNGAVASRGGGAGSVIINNCQPPIPPMIYISNGNSLNTFYGLSASNLYSCNSYTNDLYISGNVYGANLITANVSTILNAVSITSQSYSGNAYGLSNLNASNLTGTISNTNLPPSGVTAGTYGSSTNVSQVTVDQYGIVTAAANIPVLSSQWVAVDGNIAYQNAVSIGSITNPPEGSNLYVFGSANISDTLNVNTLHANSAIIFGSSTLNVFGISNLNSVLASLYIGDGSGISNLNSSNLVGNASAAEVASSVTDPAQPNITSVGTLTGLTVNGLLVASNGSGISNLNSSNLVGNVAAANVASSVTNPSQTNITSVGTLTGLAIQGLLVASNGSGISNLNSSNLVGNVAAANVASSVTDPSQTNITSVGTLTGLTVNGLLVASNGSGISNLNSSNLVGNVAAANVASSVTNPAQTNITSVGTLTGLTINGLLVVSNGSGISNINSSNLVGNVAAANVASSVTNPSQPNITSVGTLTGLTVAGVVSANLLGGNGSGISNINGSNVVSTVGTAQSVTAVAQPNITSVGTLTNLSVTGSVVAGTISGDGQGLFGLHANAITETVATANSVVQPAQTNITSVGTLTGLTVAGLLVASNASGLSNVPASNLVGAVSSGNLPTSGVTAGLYGSGANVSSVTVDQYGRVTNASNVAITASQWTSNTGNTIYYANYVGIGTTFVPTANLHVVGNAYVSNSVTTTNIFFTNTIQDTNLPVTGVAAGGYGSSANIPQIVVDQYGRLTSASNVTLPPTSQWTSINANVAFGNGVSIGTLTNPPVGSNLYVLGTANIDAINTSSLSISNLNLVSSSIVNLLVPTQLNAASANILTDNVTTSNIVSANVGSLNVSGGANVTNLSVRTQANLASANVPILNVSFAANVSNIRVTTLANLVSANVTTINIATDNVVTANIVTLNISSAANITNLRVSTMANLVSANISGGNIATANFVTANIVTGNLATGNVVTANIGSLTVPGALTSNSTNLTFLYDTILIPYLNVSVAANVTAVNVVTMNATSIFGTNSNLALANIGTGNVSTLNVSSILITNSNLVAANIGTENVLTLNASSIFGTNSNLVEASITTGNVLTLNVSSILGTNSNLVEANVTTSNILTLNAVSFFGTTSNLVTANVATENVLTLNAVSFFGTTSNLVTANVATENVTTLNASSIFGTNSNLLTLNATSLSTFYDAFIGPVRVGRGANLVASDTVLGANVLLNDPGANNTAIGYQSMKSAQPFVGYDTALGADTLQSDVGPGYNTAIGAIAMLNSNPTNGQDVAVGFSSLQNDVASGYNTAIGTYSMQNANPNGGNDVAVGYYALSSDSGPGYNTALGGQAMQGANPGGGYDVAVGWQSLQNDTGGFNTAIGANAGQGITGGAYNTALGASSGPYSSGLSNTTSIGSNAHPTASDVAVFPYGINVGINTSAPGASLEVQGNVFVSNSITTPNLTVTSNIVSADASGNTYLTGNIIVSGNVFSALGMPLGSGGGYYFSLPGDIALQTPYTGALYGATYPLSVGLSNGFTINGTSTLITVTPNGNFQFGVAGPYLLRAVFNSTDNIRGLAVGSNVADIHGTDQGYMYRYTTFITQNPTELIEIPFNVTDTSKYYYLDLFSTDGGSLFQTANTAGGTYLTITPLQGGGLATGGPGGTPGTQWISSGSNIYFPNSVGIGAVNPQYNLDVSTGTAAARQIVTSNISSLGLYGPLLNVSSNVIIQSNLAVGGGVASTPPYALYVTGQGYFSQHVSYENFSGYRNRLINGTFRIAARANILTVSNTSVFSLSNAFVMDRWHVDAGNLSTSNVAMTIKQDVAVGQTNGFSNVANVYVTRAFGSTLDNTWFCPLVQTVEASGVYDLRLGQSTAKPMVLSFYANAAVTGNYSVVLRSKADNTYFANLVTLTNSWNRYTVLVPACTIGTWGTGTSGSIEVCLCGVSFGTGRANVAPTTNWTASPGYAPMAVTGAVNWMSTAPSLLQVTGVQLELGTITTPFEIRILSETTRMCQRYFETNPDMQYCAALSSGRISTVPFVVTKRANANVSVYVDFANLTSNTNVSQFNAFTGASATPSISTINSYLPSDYGFSFNFTQGGRNFNQLISEANFVWTADAEIY